MNGGENPRNNRRQMMEETEPNTGVLLGQLFLVSIKSLETKDAEPVLVLMQQRREY
jgi:hypothetical protein